MSNIQLQIRKSYWEKLHVLMENCPHQWKREFKFVDYQLIQPRLRRMNEKKEFADEPLPKNLPYSGLEPKYPLRIDMIDERKTQFQKLLHYHGFVDQRGRCQNSLFVEALIFRAYKNLEKKDPEAVKRTKPPLESDYGSMIPPIGPSHEGENWFGKND